MAHSNTHGLSAGSNIPVPSTTSNNSGMIGLHEHEKGTSNFQHASTIQVGPLWEQMANELLGKIFEHCIHMEKGEYKGVLQSYNSNAPLLLGQICSRWRAVAITTPSLWCTIRIAKGEYIASDCGLAKFENWLRRSGSLPISLYLCDHYIVGNVHHDRERLFQALATSRHRWQYISLDITPQSYGEIFRMTDSLPLLRKLALSFSRGIGWNDIEVNVFKDAPLLRDVSLVGEALPKLSRLPWNQMTDLICNLPDFNWKKYLRILRLCSSLINCNITEPQAYVFLWSNQGLANPRQCN